MYLHTRTMPAVLATVLAALAGMDPDLQSITPRDRCPGRGFRR
jgi:hypothetical protein